MRTIQQQSRAGFPVVGHVSATYTSQLVGAAEIILFFILSLKFGKCGFFNFFFTFQRLKRKSVKKQAALPDSWKIDNILNLHWSAEQTAADTRTAVVQTP